MKESITLKPSTTNVYLCSWNYGDIVQIHTRETLYNEYKDTNLFDDCNIIGKYHTEEEVFKNLHELLNKWEEYKFEMDCDSYTEDNFTIQLIKEGEI